MEEREPKKTVVREYLEIISIAVIVAVIIRLFIVEPFKIPSGSMIPSLLVGDHLLVSKFLYKFAEPKRGDIAVFKYPDDPLRNFIKRIVAVGGDTVEIRDKIVYVNGARQDEPFVQHVFPDILPARYSPRDNFGPITVPANTFFMLGDNRDSSLDSRFWDHRFVARRALVGKALVIYWSWKQENLPEELPNESVWTKLIRAGKTMIAYITHLPGSVRWNRFGRVVK